MSVQERRDFDAYYRARFVKKKASLSTEALAEKRKAHAKYCRERKAGLSDLQRQKRRESQTKWMAEKRANNREAFREADRKWKKKKRAESPEFRLTTILRKRLSKAVVRYGMKEAKPSALLLVGCTRTELRLYLEKQFKPGMSWENYGFRGWHVDHIRPVSSFNLLNEEEMRACFQFTNLQPMWGILNMRKGNRFQSSTN
jgi:hypothetical protein